MKILTTILIIAVTLFWMPRKAEAAIVLGNHNIFQTTVNGGTSGTYNTGSCDLIVVTLVYQGGATYSALTDSKGNTYTEKVAPNQGADGSNVTFFYTYGASVGDANMTWTLTGTAIAPTLAWACFTGARTSSDPWVAVNGANSGSPGSAISSFQPGSISTNSGELIVTVLGNFGDSDDTDRSINSGFTVTDQTGFTAATAYPNGTAYKIATGGSENPTWSWTSGDQTFVRAGIITFAAAADATPNTPVKGYIGGQAIIHRGQLIIQ